MSDSPRQSFFTIMKKNISQFHLRKGVNQFGSGQFSGGCESHIQRTIWREGESPCRIIELHGRSTQIKEDTVYGIPSHRWQLFSHGRVGGLDQNKSPLVRSQGLPSEFQGMLVDVE